MDFSESAYRSVLTHGQTNMHGKRSSAILFVPLSSPQHAGAHFEVGQIPFLSFHTRSFQREKSNNPAWQQNKFDCEYPIEYSR
ncbi:hypothetical protein [Burkholderia sp. S-53]|uniref:hypothetical protein n=1 Tax=Burkholderia sp. S-53 TaxID=2906514 RepID=UPI0021D0007C|nr:hypothetical protein [Burkholderia sp. S-53]UXU89988.1 hypothetical protein LXM88_32190 [Burkholderia sp. S-53]